MPTYEDRGDACGHAWSRRDMLAERGGEPPAARRHGTVGAQVRSASLAASARKR
jgi:hypothetical protein